MEFELCRLNTNCNCKEEERDRQGKRKKKRYEDKEAKLERRRPEYFHIIYRGGYVLCHLSFWYAQIISILRSG